MMEQSEQAHKLPLTKDRRLFVRIPGALVVEIQIAAEDNYQTVSEYVRSVLTQDVIRRAGK